MMTAIIQADRPTLQALVEAIGERDGIDAQSLADMFVEKGFARYEVQRAIQNALEKGVLDLGPKLHLYVARQEAPALDPTSA